MTSGSSPEVLPFCPAWKHSLESSGTGDAQGGQGRRSGGASCHPCTPQLPSHPPAAAAPRLLIRAELSLLWVSSAEHSLAFISCLSTKCDSPASPASSPRGRGDVRASWTSGRPQRWPGLSCGFPRFPHHLPDGWDQYPRGTVHNIHGPAKLSAWGQVDVLDPPAQVGNGPFQPPGTECAEPPGGAETRCSSLMMSVNRGCKSRSRAGPFPHPQGWCLRATHTLSHLPACLGPGCPATCPDCLQQCTAFFFFFFREGCSEKQNAQGWQDGSVVH